MSADQSTVEQRLKEEMQIAMVETLKGKLDDETVKALLFETASNILNGLIRDYRFKDELVSLVKRKLGEKIDEVVAEVIAQESTKNMLKEKVIEALETGADQLAEGLKKRIANLDPRY